MNRFSLIFAACLLLVLSFDVSAQEPTTVPAEGKDRGGLFAQLDKDGDGKISRAEWTRKPKAFDRLDLNHDGFITREEAAEAHGKSAVPKGGKAVRRGRVAEMDTNGDGKIARDEWRGKSKAFDRLDADHDGFLTREELLAARGKGVKK